MARRLTVMRGEPIVVLGAGGHAHVVVATLLDCGWPVAGIFDDDDRKWGQSILGLSVLGSTDEVPDSSQVWAVLTVGSNRQRQQLAQRFRRLRWKTTIHPTAYVHDSVRVGPGTVIMAHAVVQPGSRLGAHVIVNTSASIDHGCTIEEFAHVAPGVHLGGEVHVQEGTLLGVGGSVAPRATIGPWSTVGAGAVVVSDLPGHTTAVGVPARALTDSGLARRRWAA